MHAWHRTATSYLATTLVALFALPAPAVAQGPPPGPTEPWASVAALDVLGAARTCIVELGCTSFDPPDGLELDPAQGQPLMSVHARGAMDVGPLLDWADGRSDVEASTQLVHVMDRTGFEVELAMDLLAADAWPGLLDAIEQIAAGASVSLHGVPVHYDGVHPDIASAHGQVLACGGDGACLQALHDALPWLDAWLGVGALRLEVFHDGAAGTHDAVAAALGALSWSEPPMIFEVDHLDTGEFSSKAIGRMPTDQMDGLESWAAGLGWPLESRPMTEDELSMVRLRLVTVDAAADLFACVGDPACHYDVSQIHGTVTSPAGRAGVVFHGESPDIEGLNGFEYPGWSEAPEGWVMDGVAGLLAHDALRDAGLGRWELGEALSVGLDTDPALVDLTYPEWEAAWGVDDLPIDWQGDDDDSAAGDDDDSAAGDDDDSAGDYYFPAAGEVLAVEPNGASHSFTSIQAALDMVTGTGWRVLAGPGYYGESLIISSKNDLEVNGEGWAVVRRLSIESSSQVRIAGLKIDAKDGQVPGVVVAASPSASAGVSLTDCVVRGAGLDTPGIWVGAGSSVDVSRTRVYENGGDGLVLESGSGPHRVRESFFYVNGRSGIDLHLDTQLELVASTFFLNGQAEASGSGYGLHRHRAAGGADPEDVQLIENLFLGNRGEALPGTSSSDLGNHDQILNGTDHDNATTDGDEGPGVGEVDYEFPIRGRLPTDAELAGMVLPEEVETGLVAGRDLILAARESLADQHAGEHPFAEGVTLTAGEPLHAQLDCWSPSVVSVVDYIVDASLQSPPPSPPYAYLTIHEALAAAGVHGDVFPDGGIRICVMPGIYPGGFEIEAGLVESPPGTALPFYIWGAFGPDVTVVEGFLPGSPLPANAVAISNAGFPTFEVYLGGLTVRDYDCGPFRQGDCPGSAIDVELSTLSLREVVVEFNYSVVGGGGLHARGSTVSVLNTTFHGNRGHVDGGAVVLDAVEEPPGSWVPSAVTVSNSRFWKNGAFDTMSTGLSARGGAISAREAEEQSTLAVHTSEFMWNQSGTASNPEDQGGAVWARGAVVDEVWFEGNHSSSGGGIYDPTGHTEQATGAQAFDSVFWGNQAAFGSIDLGGCGGGMVSDGAVVENSEFLENFAQRRGGGIEGTSITISDSSFVSNEAPFVGGGGVAILGTPSSLPSLIINTEFLTNHGSSGGALNVGSRFSGTDVASPVSVQGGTFKGNTAMMVGGAISSLSSDMELIEGVGTLYITGNTATQAGGGIYQALGSLSVLGDVQIEYNDAMAGGGVVFRNNADTGGEVLTLDGVTVSGNQALAGHGGGVLIEFGSLDATGILVEGNTASGSGGGIALVPNGTFYWSTVMGLALSGSSVLGNTASGDGGGLYYDDPFTSVPNGTEVDILIGPGAVSGTNTVIQDNTASGSGGGLHVGQKGVLDMESVEVLDNTVTGGHGGGISLKDWQDLSIDGGVVDGNDAFLGTGGTFAGDGGGLFAEGSFGDIAITDLTAAPVISNNVADDDGGGMELYAYQNVSFTGLVLEGNDAGDNGGGIFARGGFTWQYQGGGLYGNTAAGTSGGGIHLVYAGIGAFEQLEIVDNSAPFGEGGAVWVDITSPAPVAYQLDFVNVLVAGNTADRYAMYFHEQAAAPSTLDMLFVTVAGNRLSAPGSGNIAGVRLQGNMDYTIDSSVIAYNEGPRQLAMAIAGGSVTDSLIYSDDTSAPWVIDSSSGCACSYLEDEPGFADSSGLPPYQVFPAVLFDYHPGPGSPLIDQGSPAYADPDSSPADIGSTGGPDGDWDCTYLGC